MQIQLYRSHIRIYRKIGNVLIIYNIIITYKYVIYVKKNILCATFHKIHTLLLKKANENGIIVKKALHGL